MKPISNLIILSLLIINCSDKKASTNTNSTIPDGAIWTTQKIKHENAPPNFSAMLIWAQTATLTSDQPKTTKALVTIDYWKIIENVGNTKNIIYEEHYNYSTQKYFTTDDAGLYCRFPTWYDTICHDHHDFVFNMFAINSLLTIDVSQTPDKIIHWWTPRQTVNPNATYSVEVRIKVEGNTAVQFGSDYWRNLTAKFNWWDANCVTSNNCEAWISNWITDTQAEFITVTLPNR